MQKPLVNEPEILEMMTKMQEQLKALNWKMDIVLAKSSAQPPTAKPVFKPPVKAFVPNTQQSHAHQSQGRPVFRATCADCQKACELPFKPSGDRPVYCKECFAKRRAGNAFNAPVNRPQVQTPIAPPVAAVVSAPVNVPKKKPSLAKKSAAKKPAAKKRAVGKKKRK